MNLPRTLLGLAEDTGCENFTDGLNGRHNHPAPPGHCLTKANRLILAQFGADRACWPCTITALLEPVADTTKASTE